MNTDDDRPDLDLRPKLHLLMHELHMIKSALYLDTALASNLNVTRQIGRMNDLQAKMLDFYRELTGEAPPAAPPLKVELAESGSIKSYDSRRAEGNQLIQRQFNENPVRHQTSRSRKPGRPPKSDEQKIVDMIEKAAQPKRPKKKKPAQRKVQGGRKGHRPPNAPNS